MIGLLQQPYSIKGNILHFILLRLVSVHFPLFLCSDFYSSNDIISYYSLSKLLLNTTYDLQLLLFVFGKSDSKMILCQPSAPIMFHSLQRVPPKNILGRQLVKDFGPYHVILNAQGLFLDKSFT